MSVLPVASGIPFCSDEKAFFKLSVGEKDDKALMKSTHHFFMVQEAAGRLLGRRRTMEMLSSALATSLMARCPIPSPWVLFHINNPGATGVS